MGRYLVRREVQRVCGEGREEEEARVGYLSRLLLRGGGERYFDVCESYPGKWCGEREREREREKVAIIAAAVMLIKIFFFLIHKYE